MLHRAGSFLIASLIATTLPLTACVSVSYSERSRQMDRPTASAGMASGSTDGASVSSDRRASSEASRSHYVVRDTLEALGASTITYTQHVMTLANPFFEGRSADTRGGKLAAEYLAFHFERTGLEPAFPAETGAASAERSYLQSFDVPGGVEVVDASASYRVDGSRTRLLEGEDFSVLGASASGSAEGPLAFVGYSITNEDENYSSYAEGDDLSGHIAMVLRFEPMDHEGKSRWSNFGRWTANAALTNKIQAAIDRGAAGVILVNPPGADDPRADELASTSATRFSQQMDVPVVMFSTEKASELIQAADPDGGTLMKWRLAADDGDLDGIVTFDNVEVSLGTELERHTYTSYNVGAVLPGKGELADEWVVVGGHFDHLGYGRVGGTRGSTVGELHPGADDNASGAAGVLMVAEAMKEQYDELPEDADRRSVLFLEFGAEEMGLLGSAHFIENTTVSASQVVAMLNMDMIGRMSDRKLTVYGTGTAEEWDEVLTPHFERSGLEVEQIASGTGASDHTNFYRADIPVLHFFSGLHEDYHRPGDFAWKVNYAGAMDILKIVTGAAMDLAARDGRLTFTPTQVAERPSRTRARVRLGIAPGSYARDTEGVVVGDVFPNTSADEGGMRAGDRIVRWDGEEVSDVMSMMEHLQAHEPGDVARIVVVRDGEEVTLRVKLKAREEGG